MIERLLYRLPIAKYADDFVLKGGLLLHILFAGKARATRDIVRDDEVGGQRVQMPLHAFDARIEALGVDRRKPVSFMRTPCVPGALVDASPADRFLGRRYSHEKRENHPTV